MAEDFLDSFISKLSPEALHKLELIAAASEDNSWECYQAQRDDIAMQGLENEASVKLRYISKEIADFNHLLNEGIWAWGYASAMFAEEPISPNQIQQKLESYKTMIDKLAKAPQINIDEMHKKFEDLQVTKNNIQAIECRIKKYANLPPNRSRGKDAIEKLEEEIKCLKEAVERNCNAEVGQYYG